MDFVKRSMNCFLVNDFSLDIIEECQYLCTTHYWALFKAKQRKEWILKQKLSWMKFHEVRVKGKQKKTYQL